MRIQLFGEPILDIVLVDNLRFKRVRPRLRVAEHLNHLRVSLATSGLQRCNCLLCHDLLDLFVNSHLAQNRVEFLQLDAIRGVLPILRRNVTRRAGLA